MIATSGFLTVLECTKFVFGRGSAQDPLAGLMGPTSKGEGMDRDERGKGRVETAPLRKLLYPLLV